MGRHTRQDTGVGARRVGVTLAAVGLGILPLAGLGLSGAALAAPAPAPAAPAGEAVGSPCAKTVKACARLSTNEAWVTDGQGEVLRGPVRINHGADDTPTPTGSFRINRMERYHVSKEYEGSKMPYSAFFDGNGRAFHGGDPARQSAGCIRMADADAKFFFENLAVGDSVQILP